MILSKIWNRTIVLVSVLLISLSSSFSQSFYNLDSIQTIRIYFTQPNWDYMMDTAKSGSEGYIMASKVFINYTEFDSVGVKYKGNSTYKTNQKKNPLHIELDTYKDQDYQGFKDIKLSTGDKDPSFIREALSYYILRNYMIAPQSNFAKVYINDEYYGVYTNSESIGKTFVDKYFGSKKNPFFKCNPIDGAGPGTGSYPNLKYLGDDSSQYYSAYEMKSDYGWKELINLCWTLENDIDNIENILDVDKALWMLAFDNLLVNLDSYIGGFTQNYYLYKDNSGRFSCIVWDLNESFGTFDQTGTIQLRTTADKSRMDPFLHINDNDWSLIKNLLSVPEYKKTYIAHYKTILKDFFENDEYMKIAEKMQDIVEDAYKDDPNKFFSYDQFKTNLTSDVEINMEIQAPPPIPNSNEQDSFKKMPPPRPQGFRQNNFNRMPPPRPNINDNFTFSEMPLPIPPGGPGKSAPGLKALMEARTEYLLSLEDFSYEAPVIEDINLSNPEPSVNTDFTITAKVSNANSVFLAYRYGVYERFLRTQMFDDGNHNDQEANDGIYGATITASSNIVQYYIYAENDDAAMFSPERAEFEYYTVNIKTYISGNSNVVINEILASNKTIIQDPQGDYDDWIELYNKGNEVVDLSSMYLSDKIDNFKKWQFPENTILQPDGYLIIWADEDGKDEPGLHANFKLSASGETLMLIDKDGSSILDSIQFGEQTADISYGRYPNGVGEFTFLPPTPGSVNTKTVSVNDDNYQLINIYPNPFSSVVTIRLDDESYDGFKSITISNNLGLTIKEISEYSLNSDSLQIDLSEFPNGIYYFNFKYLTYIKVFKVIKV